MPLTLHAPPVHNGDGAPAASDLTAAARRAADVAAAHEAETDSREHPPEPGLAALHSEGLLHAPAAPSYGGRGMGTLPDLHAATYRVLCEIGRGGLPLGRLYEGHVNAFVLINTYGTAEQQARAAEDARRGHLFGVWNTEIPSEAVRLGAMPGGRMRMEGAKVFCSGAGRVTRAVVPGDLPDGQRQMTLVPLDEVDAPADPAWWRAEGMRASQSGRVDFDGVVLDASAVLGMPGDYTRQPLFTGGAVRFAAVQLGGAEALAQAAAEHLQRLGRTEHPVQQIRMGEIAVALETGRLWLDGAARLEGSDASPDEITAYADMARSAIERVCLDVLERVDRAVGARGLVPPSRVEKVGRDLRLYLRQPNPDGALAHAGEAFLSRLHA